MSPRHHIVPQVYLRNFADDSKRVLLVDRDDSSRTHLTVVRKAIAEVGFYRLDPDAFLVEDGAAAVDPELFERHLSKFERSAAPGLYKLVHGQLHDLSRHDWFHLINLMALQTVRGNRFREDVGAAENHAMRIHLGETVTDDTIRTWLTERGEPASAKAVSDFRADMLGPKGPRLIPTQEHLIREGVKLAFGMIGERLADMEWTLVEARHASVLTGDEPVCWWSPADDPVGFGSAHVVWFPVSPRRILQLRRRDLQPEALGLPDTTTTASSDQLVRLVNGEVAAQAHRWIVHRPGDNPLAGVRLKPRTKWGDELVRVEENASGRREIRIHRRLPVDRHEGEV